MNTIGIVLAGGKSSRMGQDKATLTFDDGTTWLTHAIRQLKQVGCSSVYISGRNGFECTDASKNNVTDVDKAGYISDYSPHAGPAAAIWDAYHWLVNHRPLLIINTTTSTSLLDAAKTQLLIVPVDLPQLNQKVLMQLLSSTTQSDVMHFVRHPLPLLIRLTPAVIAHFQTPSPLNSSIRQSLSDLNVAIIPTDRDIEFHLANVNTPDEWQQWHSTSKNHS